MRRRSVLKGMAALLAMNSGSFFGMPALQARARTMRRVRPGDAAWPSAGNWQKLKDAVEGNLVEVHPLFGTCGADPKGAACQSDQKNIRNPFYVGDQPAGTQVSGWLDAWMPAPSVYAVKARNASDVAAAVNFAREEQSCVSSSRVPDTATRARRTHRTRC